MATHFVGEVKLFATSFEPAGWAFCDGRVLTLTPGNQPLFEVLGNTFGGNGITTFALPDLRGYVPMSQNEDFPIGSRVGSQAHTLTINEMPAHDHFVQATTTSANTESPVGAVLARAKRSVGDIYADATVEAEDPDLVAMGSSSVTNAGGGQAHNNMQPFLVLTFCIALTGDMPSVDPPPPPP